MTDMVTSATNNTNMTIGVNFFGISFYTGYSKHPRNGRWASESEIKSIPDGEYKHQINFCYFVLDLGRQTNKPILFWSMIYKSKKTLEKFINVSKNSGVALLNSKKVRQSNSGLTVAEKVVTVLKMKLFGNEEVPIKELTHGEWKNRYCKLSRTFNNIPDL